MSIDTIEPNAAASAMPSRALKLAASVLLRQAIMMALLFLPQKV